MSLYRHGSNCTTSKCAREDDAFSFLSSATFTAPVLHAASHRRLLETARRDGPFFFLLTCFNRNVDDVATFQAGAGDGTKMDGENMLWEQQVAINREVLNGNEAFVVSTHLSLY